MRPSGFRTRDSLLPFRTKLKEEFAIFDGPEPDGAVVGAGGGEAGGGVGGAAEDETVRVGQGLVAEPDRGVAGSGQDRVAAADVGGHRNLPVPIGGRADLLPVGDIPDTQRLVRP